MDSVNLLDSPNSMLNKIFLRIKIIESEDFKENILFFKFILSYILNDTSYLHAPFTENWNLLG